MRTQIAFKAEDGTTLRGWHYLPDQRSGQVPTIVMAHGFSAVKEMFLDRFLLLPQNHSIIWRSGPATRS